MSSERKVQNKIELLLRSINYEHCTHWGINYWRGLRTYIHWKLGGCGTFYVTVHLATFRPNILGLFLFYYDIEFQDFLHFHGYNLEHALVSFCRIFGDSFIGVALFNIREAKRIFIENIDIIISLYETEEIGVKNLYPILLSMMTDNQVANLTLPKDSQSTINRQLNDMVLKRLTE